MLKVTTTFVFVAIGSIPPCLAETRPLSNSEKKLIMAAYGAGLKDSGSAQYQWADLVVSPDVKGDEMGYCFRVNAKNSYGGYTGFKTIAGGVRRSAGRIVRYKYTLGGRDSRVMKQQTSFVRS